MKTNIFMQMILGFSLLSLFAIQGCEETEEILEPILLDCSFFQTNQILENDPNRPVDYIVPCVAQVTASIVIKAGVVIEFNDDAGLNVSTGSLKVEGTESEKVVFTGVNKVKGAWRGIFIRSNSVNNVINHAIISYGGGNSFNSNNDRANLICYNGKVAVTNSEISMGKEHGFSCIYSSGEIMEFTNNVITNNEKYPVYSLTPYGLKFDGSNDFSGNEMDYIYLKGGNVIGGNHTWGKTSVPYLINGSFIISDNQSLKLESDAMLLFEDNSSIVIQEGGYLSSMGEQNNMVTLSGLVSQPGSWKGIINYSADLRNVIDYTEIAYAGGGAHNSNGDLGTIIVWANANQTVTNSILRDAAPAAECAILYYSSANLNLSGNTISNIINESCD